MECEKCTIYLINRERWVRFGSSFFKMFGNCQEKIFMKEQFRIFHQEIGMSKI